MTQVFVRLDAGESVFFARELEVVKSKSYDIKYANLKARTLIPVNFSTGPGAQSLTYEQYDQVGIAKIISDYARDFPRADIKGKEFTSTIKSLGASYGYSLQEIRSAQMAGKPLATRRASAARKAIAIKENRLAWIGDANANLPGWLTNPNIPDVVLLNDGSGSLTTFASKITTPDKIVRDLNEIVNAVVIQSNEVESPNALLMPIAQKTLIGSTPRSTTSDTTILEYFMKNNMAGITDCEMVVELAASNGFVGSDTCIAYDRNPDAMELEIPQDYEEFAPQEKGMEYEIACHERIGGVLIYYPLSQAKTDDI